MKFTLARRALAAKREDIFAAWRAQTASDISALMLTMLRHGRSLLAQGILALALLAAGIQASLPQGFMLDRNSGSGAISVVFCTGHGSEQRWLDLATGDVRDSQAPDPAGNERGQPCAFAVAAAAMGPLPPVPVFPAPLRTGTGTAPAGQAAPVTDYRRPRPPVRAPPAAV